MKNNIWMWLLAGLLCVGTTACESDDTDDFSDYINNPTDTDDKEDDGTTEEPTDSDGDQTLPSDTIYIAYAGTTATVTNDTHGYVTTNGADVTVDATDADTTLVIALSGTTTDGSLMVYRQLEYTILLNGISITNPDGPAINNQCGKALYIVTAAGTTNTLTDGSAYAAAPTNSLGEAIDQKGALFSEGQIYFQGSGTLNVYGNYKNGIASDDFIVFERGSVNVSVSTTGSNGVKANDGVTIEGGTLKIGVTADGARGIRSEARTTINGGTTTITTSGDCEIEEADGVRDTTSAAGIKCDSLFTMTGGTLTITSTGDGGKGINCSENVEISGGTLTVKTTGSNDVGKPKGIKSDTAIIVSGGSTTITVKKSWACDNGTDSEEPADHVTVQGSPTTCTLAKKSVTIRY